MANKTQLLQCNIDLKPGQDSKSCTPSSLYNAGCLNHIHGQVYNMCMFVLMVKVGGLRISKCRITASEVRFLYTTECRRIVFRSQRAFYGCPISNRTAHTERLTPCAPVSTPTNYFTKFRGLGATFRLTIC